MALSDLELLKAYMKPYYQEDTPENDAFLQHFLDTEGSPECAAAKLWNMKKGEIGGGNENIKELRDGSETVKFEDPSKSAGVADKQAAYYQKECNKVRGFSSCSIVNVKRNPVGGAVYEPQYNESESS